MPKLTPTNPYALLDSLIGSAIRQYLDYARPAPYPGAPTQPAPYPKGGVVSSLSTRKRKKRSDAGKARGPRKQAKPAKAAWGERASPPKPTRKRLKHAKPRVDPFTDIKSEEA